LPVDFRSMRTADAPGYVIPAGGEDLVPVFAGSSTIPVAVFDAALEPCTHRIMGLPIPGAELANAAVATDMGVSGSALKRNTNSNGMPSTITAHVPITVPVRHITLGAGPGR
jgi:hypothetical protein